MTVDYHNHNQLLAPNACCARLTMFRHKMYDCWAGECFLFHPFRKETQFTFMCDRHQYPLMLSLPQGYVNSPTLLQCSPKGPGLYTPSTESALTRCVHGIQLIRPGEEEEALVQYLHSKGWEISPRTNQGNITSVKFFRSPVVWGISGYPLQRKGHLTESCFPFH